MLTEERVNRLGLVCREVVDDDVNFLAARLMGHDVGEEGDELGRGMPRGGLAQHFTSLGIEGGVQRERSMPEVLKAMPLATPRRERQHRVFAIERLNRRLLVDAEDGRMLRRGQIQTGDIRWPWCQEPGVGGRGVGGVKIKADDIGCLGCKVRIVGGEIAPSSRCGLSPCLAQMRATVMCEMSPPSSAASLRVDQCVEPSAGLCLVVRANTRASRRSVTL